MRVAFFQSLPVRLAAYILTLSGITLLGLTEWNRRAVERLLLEQAEVQAAMATNAVADGLDGVTGAVERLVRLVALDLATRPVDPAEAERLARNALADMPQVYGFAVALASSGGAAAEPANQGTEPGAPARPSAAVAKVGVAVYRSNTAARFRSLDLSAPERAFWERDWYREAVEKGVVRWSEPFFDQEGAESNVVRLVAPVWREANGERAVAGVVAALVELDWLRRLANRNEFSDTSFTIVFSPTGRVLVHPKSNYTMVETMETLADKTNAPELADIRQKVAAKRQGVTRYREAARGGWVHANFKPVKTGAWGVLVGFQEEEFLRSQREFRKSTAVFLGAALLALAGIVIGVTRSALRPLGRLAEASGEIAKQNFDCVVPEPARTDEVGRLASAFKAMRDALKTHQLERRWSAQAQEHQLKYNQLIIDSIGELVFVLTKSLHVTRINPAVTRVAGYAPSDLVRASIGHCVALGGGAAADAAGKRAADAALLGETLRAAQSLPDTPALLTTKSGTKLGGRLTMVPLIDENRVVGAVVTLRLNEAGRAAGCQEKS